MIIKRTARAGAATFWVHNGWDYEQAHPFASQVHQGDTPTHSTLLGPDGSPLQYEGKPRMGFDLKRRMDRE